MGDRTHLFVYGTLRPPREDRSPVYSVNYPKIVPFLHSIQEAWVDGAELYDLGAYPAAIPGDGRVIGALLEIDRAAFDLLDPLEGHPDLYHREIVQAQTRSGPVDAWIYWAPEDLALEGVRVGSGDWLLDQPPRPDEPGL